MLRVMRTDRAVGLLAALSLLILVGCAPKNVQTLKRDAPAIEVPQGWTLREEAGYSIVVPNDYRVPTGGTMGASDLQNLGSAGASYGLAPAQESNNANAQLTLVDRNFRIIPGEPATGMTMNIHTRNGGADSEAELNRIKDAFMKEEVTMVDLPVGSIPEVKARFKLISGDEVWVIVYLFCDKDKVYEMRFETTNGADAIKEKAAWIASSFRVTA